MSINAGLNLNDISKLTLYNDALKMGITNTTALEAAMSGASPAAHAMAVQIQNGTVQLNELTTASKAAQLGMSLLYAAMNIGVSFAISFVIKQVYELAHAYESVAEKADNALAKLQERKDENNQLQELIDKYKELKEAETSENKQETRKQALELQKEITNLIAKQPDLYDKQLKNIDLVNGKLDEQLGLLGQINQENSKSVIKSAANAYRNAVDAAKEYKYDSEGGQIGGKNIVWLDGETENVSNDANGQAIINKLLKRKFVGDSKFSVDSFGKDYYGIEFAENTNWVQRLKFLDEVIEALEQSAEFDTSQKGLYDQLLDAREDINKVVEKEVQAATDYAQLLAESSVQTNMANIESYSDFAKTRKEILDELSDDGTIKKALIEGALSDEDINSYVDEYISTLNNLSDYYDEWVRRNTNNYENMTDAEKAWAVQTRENIHSIASVYKSAYSEIKDIEEDKPQLTLFDVSEYTNSLKDVDKAISSFESAIKSIDNNEMPDAEFFGKFPELAQYADDLTLLRQKIFELMSSYPDEVIQELKTLKENIDLSKESLEEEFKLLSAGGTVDLANRPVINTEELKKAGWSDVEDGVATVYTSGYSNGQTGKKAIAINFTPIVADENGNYIGVLSPDELEEYAQGVIAGIRNDDLHLQIGAKFTGKKAVEESEAAAENIHKLQEYYYVYNDKQRQQESQKQKKQIDGLITMLDRLGHKAKEVNGVLTNLSVDDYVKYEEKNIQNIIDKLEAEKDAQNEILDSLKEQKEQLEQIISDYEKTASAVEKYIDKTQIEPLEQRKSDVEEYYNAQIEALKAENEERDRNIELQKAQDALANARKTKVRMYNETQGWHTEFDTNAIKNAENELSSLQNEITIDDLEKQRDSEVKDIEEQIEAWEDYKEQWKEQVEQITKADEELTASKILGADWHEKIANQDIDVMVNFGSQYQSYNNRLHNQVNVEISNMEKAIKSRENEIAEWKNYKTQLSDINTSITESNDTYLQSLNQFIIDENSTWEQRIKHMRRNAQIIAELNGQANEVPEIDAKSALTGSNLWGIARDGNVLKLYASESEAKADKENIVKDLVKKQIAPGMPSDVVETITKRIMESLEIKQYARGGINTNTGLAWLDGTNTKSEVIFNSAQAKQLYDIVRNGNYGEMISKNILNNINNQSALSARENANRPQVTQSINVTFPNATINAKDYDSFKGFMDRYTNDLLLKMQVGL